MCNTHTSEPPVVVCATPHVTCGCSAAVSLHEGSVPVNVPLVELNVVVPALLAGNSVLLKHSPLTPLCGEHFERAFASLSVPDVLQNVVVQNARAEELIEDSRIDHVAFTGSVATVEPAIVAGEGVVTVLSSVKVQSQLVAPVQLAVVKALRSMF